MDMEVLCKKLNHFKPIYTICVQKKCPEKGALCENCIPNHIGHKCISFFQFERDKIKKFKQI